MTIRRKRSRGLSPEEAELWRAVVRDAEPLHRPVRRAAADGPGATAPDDPAAEPLPPPIPPIPKPAPKTPQRRGPVQPAPVTSAKRRLEELAHGETANIDRRTAGRFTRGRMVVDGRLDLHGMTQETAHRALCGFLARAYDAGHRCVIVVTGKGLRGEGSGILRRMVPQWLNEAGLRTRILSFSYAQPRDGGEGALYVLLKRKR